MQPRSARSCASFSLPFLSSPDRFFARGGLVIRNRGSSPLEELASFLLYPAIPVWPNFRSYPSPDRESTDCHGLVVVLCISPFPNNRPLFYLFPFAPFLLFIILRFLIWKTYHLSCSPRRTSFFPRLRISLLLFILVYGQLIPFSSPGCNISLFFSSPMRIFFLRTLNRRDSDLSAFSLLPPPPSPPPPPLPFLKVSSEFLSLQVDDIPQFRFHFPILLPLQQELPIISRVFWPGSPFRGLCFERWSQNAGHAFPVSLLASVLTPEFQTCTVVAVRKWFKSWVFFFFSRHLYLVYFHLCNSISRTPVPRFFFTPKHTHLVAGPPFPWYQYFIAEDRS